MDLSQRTEFCQQLLYFFENFVFVWEPRKRSWSDVPTIQTSIFKLFESVWSFIWGCFFPVSILKVNLQAALYSLQLYQNETVPAYFFSVNFRVTVVLSKYFQKVLKGYTAKLLYQRLGKHLNIKYLHVLDRVNALKKSKG